MHEIQIAMFVSYLFIINSCDIILWNLDNRIALPFPISICL